MRENQSWTLMLIILKMGTSFHLDQYNKHHNWLANFGHSCNGIY